MTTDYTPGDGPVPEGTIIDYFGSKTHGRYIITDHAAPNLLGRDVDQDEYFPDGTAYVIWKVGVPVTMDNGGHCVSNVRRPSFRVVTEQENS